MLVKSQRANNNSMFLDQLLVMLIFLVYSMFSQPIPGKPGLSEVVLAILLMFFVLRNIYIKTSTRPHIFSLFSFSWLLIVPSFVGIFFYQYPLGDYIRDAVPLLFIMLPILTYSRVSENPQAWFELITHAFLFSGSLLTFRYIFTGQGVAFEDILITDGAPLNQCSTVIFSAVVGFLMFLDKNKSNILRFLYLSISLFCFIGLLMAIMRAQIAIVLFAWFVGLLVSYKKVDVRVWVSFSLLVLVCIFFLDNMLFNMYGWVVNMIEAKNNSTGLFNNRDHEITVVMDLFWSNNFSAIFGHGWGASMYVPTAGKVVRFTHNSTLYMIWKTGFLGTVFICFYLFYTCRLNQIKNMSLSFITKNIDTLLGMSCAFIIFAVIEMGYKMMSFGFLLCLVQCCFSKLIYDKKHKVIR